MSDGRYNSDNLCIPRDGEGGVTSEPIYEPFYTVSEDFIRSLSEPVKVKVNIESAHPVQHVEIVVPESSEPEKIETKVNRTKKVEVSTDTSSTVIKVNRKKAAKHITNIKKTASITKVPVRRTTSAKTVKQPAKVTKVAAPKKHRVLSIFSTVAMIIVVVVALGLIGLRIAGFHTFTVMSGSMEPAIPVGAMIYVKTVDYHNLQVGDVISFIADSNNTVVTHRIVGIEIDRDDPSVIRYKTKGDANAIADTKTVHYKNVVGTPVFTIPLLGYAAYNVQRPPGIYIALIAATLMLAWTCLPQTLEERRKTTSTQTA